MKILSTLSIFSIIGISVFAQDITPEWTKQYARTPAFAKAYAGEMPDGNFLVNYGDWLHQISPTGDSLSTMVIPSPFSSVKCMHGLSDGMLLGGNSSTGPTVAKIDNSLAAEWTTEIATGFGHVSALLVDGTDYYASGYYSNTLFVARLDAAGDTAWVTELPQATFTNLSSIIKLSDGNFLASGNLDDYPIAVKFNASGDTLWTFDETIFISFEKMSAFERDNGEIVLIAGHHLIELNADGSKISDTDMGQDYLLDLELDGDFIYLVGSYRGDISTNENLPFIETYNEAMDSLGAFTLTQNIYPLASNEFTDILATSDGGFLAVGKVRDSVNIGGNTYKLLAMKFGGTSTPDTTDTTGIDMMALQGTTFSIYPNPAASHVYIEGLDATDEVFVVNALGEVVIRQQAARAIEVRRLKPGVYTVVAPQKAATARFVKY